MWKVEVATLGLLRLLCMQARISIRVGEAAHPGPEGDPPVCPTCLDTIVPTAIGCRTLAHRPLCQHTYHLACLARTRARLSPPSCYLCRGKGGKKGGYGDDNGLTDDMVGVFGHGRCIETWENLEDLSHRNQPIHCPVSSNILLHRYRILV